MNVFEKDLRAFHEAFGLPAPTELTLSQPDDVRELRENLIREETDEFFEAIDEKDPEQICKEGMDLLYVVVGALVTYGVPIDICWPEVQRSNMSKLGDDGKPVRREGDGKVLKGPNYSPADMTTVLAQLNNPRVVGASGTLHTNVTNLMDQIVQRAGMPEPIVENRDATE